MLGVHGKSTIGPPAGRLDQQPLQRVLSIGGERAEIREIEQPIRIRIDRTMGVRIDAAIERRHRPRTQLLPQRLERAAAGEAEDEIERRKAALRDVVDAVAPRETIEGHRRVEIVEDLDRRRRIEHELACGLRVRTVRRHHRDVRVRDGLAR